MSFMNMFPTLMETWATNRDYTARNIAWNRLRCVSSHVCFDDVDFEVPSIAMFPIPISIASLSSFSLILVEAFWSLGWFWWVDSEDSRILGTELNHGWLRHCAAVGLFSGAKSNKGTRKSAMSLASCSLKSYFSVNTLLRGQKRNWRICLNSPYLLK